jgi:ribonuclease HI
MKRAVIHADGASLGNPGPAGIGAVVEIDGHVTEIARHIGITTNNIAEYSALIAGLEEASRQGIEAVDVRLDSELAVRQMLGKYKVKNEGLKPLYAKAQALARSFKKFSIRHVPREENTHADRLSKAGAKGRVSSPSHAGHAGRSTPREDEGQASVPAHEPSQEKSKKKNMTQKGGQGQLF